jgi:hypothetical protein
VPVQEGRRPGNPYPSSLVLERPVWNSADRGMRAAGTIATLPSA